jgi:hypothetical protein
MEHKNNHSSASGANFEFFEDDEDHTSHIDLVEVQKGILSNMLTLVPPDDDEEDQEVAVGDGYHIDKKILTFKVLVYD